MKYYTSIFLAAALLGGSLAAMLFPASAEALDIKDVRKGVVRVICIDEKRIGYGTGFVINDSGTIITNHHVIDTAKDGGTIKILTDDLAERLKPEVEQKFGKRVDPNAGVVSDQLQIEIIQYLMPKLPGATVKWSDPKRDLAILESYSLQDTTPLALTKSERVSEGQKVYALGYPGVSDKVGVTAFLTLKVLDGIVASKEHNSAAGVNVYQITAEISPGNSGGPLVTEGGEVIGINSFHISSQSGASSRYAIQIDEIIKELDSRNIKYTPGGLQPSFSWGWVTVVIITLVALAGLSVAGIAAARALSKRSHKPASKPVAVLKGIRGEYAGSEIALDGNPIVIGRDPHLCQLVFPPSADDISKKHCAIRYDAANRAFLLEDCKSANGTFLQSGEEVSAGRPRRLNPNDRFYLGGPENMFEVQITAANGLPAPPPGPNPVPVLQGLQGEYAGSRIQLGPKSVIIGRDANQCDLVYPASFKDISKRHCVLRYEEASRAFLLEDCASTNGTFVMMGQAAKQVRPGQPWRLNPGDRFFIDNPANLFEVRLESRS